MIEFLLDIPLNTQISRVEELFIKKPKIELHLQGVEYEFIAWGDPICTEDFKESFETNKTTRFVVNNIYGHFYYIFLERKDNSIIIGNSLFSILPLYYSTEKNRLVCSENALSLGKNRNNNKINNRFILENILFNYPIFNSSIIEGIELLPSNSSISLSGGKLKIEKHTHIEEFFSKDPEPMRKAAEKAACKFIEAVLKYLPDRNFAVSLTGGFDGRTLAASGLYYKKPLTAYSFGSRSSWDTEIAEKLSLRVGFPYKKIDLNDNYVKAESLGCGREFILNSSGTATFARAHYLSAAKDLSGKFEHIVTGNFGSEVFRALHVSGAVISKYLKDLFDAETPVVVFKTIENEQSFKYLNQATFKQVWESLKEDIYKLPCYNREFYDLTKNQRFYVFVFEEMFRKYFGAEMVNQFKYLKNRTPFLDIDFLKELFRTELAGIHSDFYTHNPFKRFKGQVLYAHIIRRTYPELGRMITDKGYAPDDLLSLYGKMKIASSYLRRKLRKTPLDFDPYAVRRAWENNKELWHNLPVPGELFNLQGVNEGTPRELLFRITSLSHVVDNL